MCIAIYKPAHTVIPFEHLVEGQRSNPDGCGMAWVEDGKIRTFKSMSFDAWVVNYLDVIDRCGNINMLIHFRITSRGETSEDMCHPFMVGEDKCIIHNGTITNIKQEEHGTDSDTKYLAEQILSKLPENWESNIAIARMLEKYIGWSKIALLTTNDEVYIYNEEKTHWDNGIWYSNKGYIKYVPAKKADNYGVHMGYYDGNKTLIKDNMCDSCGFSYSYAALNYYNREFLCQTCLDAAKRAEATRELAKTKTAVYDQCMCCSHLFDSETMWELIIELPDSVETHPEQFHGWDVEAMDLESFISESEDKFNVPVSVCTMCYMLADDLTASGFRDITILTCPEEYDFMFDYNKYTTK